MKFDLLQFIALCFVFLSVFIIVYSSIESRDEKERKKRLNLEGPVSSDEKASLVNLLAPVIKILQPLIRVLPVPRAYRQTIQRWAVTAGMSDFLTFETFLALQLIIMLLFVYCSIALFHATSLIVIVAVIGFAFPLAWLYEYKKNRQGEILRSMPDFLDIIALSVESGLNFSSAINRILDMFRDEKNPFMEELRVMRENIRLGMSRDDALNVMATRVDTPEISAFCSLLVQASGMGISIAVTLKEQAQKIRQERFIAAERDGALTSSRILLPMVLFIFPLIFIIILAPYVLKYIVYR